MKYKRLIVAITLMVTNLAAVHPQVPVDEFLYICRDHLGSITHVVSSEGEDLQELSYDSWGRPRDPDTHTLYASSEQPVPVLGRGYTGHEHLPKFNLINMNARLYDPALGRFLMADPVITDAGWGQGYNRYAYALGNPLKYVDPTGKSVSAAIFGISVAVATMTSAYFTTVSMTGYYNIARWDFRKTSTWLGFFGGAAIGAAGAVGGTFIAMLFPGLPTFLVTTVATSIIASAGSLGIQAQAGADNRTAYNPSFSISFGFGSVDILSGNFHTFGSRTGLAETLGYAFGTVGNLLDIYHFLKALKANHWKINRHFYKMGMSKENPVNNFYRDGGPDEGNSMYENWKARQETIDPETKNFEKLLHAEYKRIKKMYEHTKRISPEEYPEGHQVEEGMRRYIIEGIGRDAQDGGDVPPPMEIGVLIYHDHPALNRYHQPVTSSTWWLFNQHFHNLIQIESPPPVKYAPHYYMIKIYPETDVVTLWKMQR
jgi:RHS repeat-associated protein